MTKMEERGDIVRRRNPSDRRQILVSLTEQGKENSSVIADSRLETAKELLKVLNDEEKETLFALLKKVIDSDEEAE